MDYSSRKLLVETIKKSLVDHYVAMQLQEADKDEFSADYRTKQKTKKN